MKHLYAPFAGSPNLAVSGGCRDRYGGDTAATAACRLRFLHAQQTESRLPQDRIVAVGLLTQRDVDLLGPTFGRLWPVEEAPCFPDLVKAIDDADRELREAAARGRPRS